MATGRKTVVAGQVIDPVAWGNPLWDQSVQEFASDADRTAQFPVAQRRPGVVTWLDDLKVWQGWDGAAWVTLSTRPTAANVRDWSVELTTNGSYGAAAGWILVASLPITAAPAGRYLLLGTVIANIGSGGAAASVRFTANTVVIGVEPRSDLDGIGRPATHSKLYGHNGGDLTIQMLINTAAGFTITGVGTNLRAVLL